MVNIPGWLKTQKLGLFLYLASGIALLIYALGFISDVYIFYAYGNKALVDFYNEMQYINTGLLWKSILLIVFALVLFMLQLNKHPAGLFTIIILTLIVAASLYLSATSSLLLLEARQNYEGLDLRSLDRYIQRGAIQYSASTLTYNLGLGGFCFLAISSLFTLITVIVNAFKVEERHEKI